MLLTRWPWPLTFQSQSHVTSIIFQSYSQGLHKKFEHWDHSFLSYAADKQRDRRTRTSYPRRLTYSAWVMREKYSRRRKGKRGGTWQVQQNICHTACACSACEFYFRSPLLAPRWQPFPVISITWYETAPPSERNTHQSLHFLDTISMRQKYSGYAYRPFPLMPSAFVLNTITANSVMNKQASQQASIFISRKQKK